LAMQHRKLRKNYGITRKNRILTNPKGKETKNKPSQKRKKPWSSSNRQIKHLKTETLMSSCLVLV
jgi:hypothetical protein